MRLHWNQRVRRRSGLPEFNRITVLGGLATRNTLPRVLTGIIPKLRLTLLLPKKINAIPSKAFSGRAPLTEGPLSSTLRA